MGRPGPLRRSRAPHEVASRATDPLTLERGLPGDASNGRKGEASMTKDSQPVVSSDEGELSAARPRRRRRGGRGRAGSAASRQAEAPEGEEGSNDRVPARSTAGMAIERDGEDGLPEAGGAKPAGRHRRGRRGGRGRGSKRAATLEAETSADRVREEPEASEPVALKPEKDGGAEAAGTGGTRPARSRRRRRKPSEAVAERAAPAKGAGARAVRTRAGKTRADTLGEETAEVRAPAEEKPARKPRQKEKLEEGAEADGAAGPTRIRRGRATVGRRRREPAPIVRRVQDKLMVITEHGERDQIAVLENRELVQHYVTRAGARSMVGNVYLGRVQNVLPGMEAAFVDLGRGRNAVLYAGEVNYASEDLDGPPPRIEQVLKGGQAVLVQVTKDPMGGKGARLTAQISMPGRYLVLVPNSGVSGISRRLPDEERRRLKSIVTKISSEGHGLIVRTAADGAGEEALAADAARLVEEWDSIEKRAKRAKAPVLLYEEPELTLRVVRDLFTDEEFRELVTDSPRIYQQVTDYLRGVAPDLVEKVRLHEGKLPVFEEFHVVEQIHKGLDRKVWLPSGGYLIIERTEAMTVIDVNTGKHVGKSNLEETVVGTNLEAAREVARQLRLRDIGGIIIVDFIDMLLEKNKQKVIDTLKEAMAQDKTRSQVFDIGPLGLLEVTRKRVSGGLLESFSETCPTCEGRGVLLTYEV